MKEVFKTILNKLKNPVILTATAVNIYSILETFEVLNFCKVDENTYMKIVGLSISILVEIGIMTNSNGTLTIKSETEDEQ